MATSAIKSFLNSQPMICAWPLITDTIAEEVLKNYFSSAASRKLSTLLSATFVYELSRNKVNLQAVSLYTMYKVVSFIKRWWVNKHKVKELTHLNTSGRFDRLLAMDKAFDFRPMSAEIVKCMREGATFEEIEKLLRLTHSETFLIAAERDPLQHSNMTFRDLSATPKTFYLYLLCEKHSDAWKESFISSKEYQDNFKNLKDTGFKMFNSDIEIREGREVLSENAIRKLTEGQEAAPAA